MILNEDGCLSSSPAAKSDDMLRQWNSFGELEMISHRLISILTPEPLVESKLGLTELLELRRLLARWLSGLSGLSPDCLAKRFKISVRLITPVSRPEVRCPGIEAADTAGKAPDIDGDDGPETA